MRQGPYEGTMPTEHDMDNAYFGGHPAVREPGSVAYRARKHLRRLIGDPETETAAEEKPEDASDYGVFKGMAGYDRLKK